MRFILLLCLLVSALASCKKTEVVLVDNYIGNYDATFKYSDGSSDARGYIVVKKQSDSEAVLTLGPFAPTDIVLTAIVKKDGSFDFLPKEFLANPFAGGTFTSSGTGRFSSNSVSVTIINESISNGVSKRRTMTGIGIRM